MYPAAVRARQEGRSPLEDADNGPPERWASSRKLVASGALALAGCGGNETGQQEGGASTEENAQAEPEPASQEEAPGSEGTSPGAGQEAATGEGTWPVAGVADEVSPSVVQINVRSVQRTPLGAPQEQEGLGSGVVYDESGLIITNNHVVEGADEVNVAFADGSTEQGRVVGGDPFTDVAVVEVDRDGLPAAEFAGGGDLDVGELAVAIGSPSGFQATVTSGVVSGLNREVPARFTGGTPQAALVDLIQTDASISPGSSGGALADRDGRVIGINVAYLPPGQTGAENIGFAIPAETATSVADQVIETGQASTPYLGVRLVDLTPEISEQFGLPVEQGAIVVDPDPDGPAAEAGIEPESVVTAIDGTAVESTGDLLVALRQYEPGDTVELTVVTDEGEQQVELELGERTGEGA